MSLKIFTLTVLLYWTSSAYAQYINGTYDYINHSAETANTLFLEDRNDFVVIGNTSSGDYFHPYKDSGPFVMNISKDGKSIIQKNVFTTDSTNRNIGYWGRVKKLTNGNFCLPVTTSYNRPYPYDPYSLATLLILNGNGDSVLLKTYTDTSLAFEWVVDCLTMPDSGYLLAGGSIINGGNVSALIIRTDKWGNLVWRKTYWDIYGINSVELLSNGHVLLGGYDLNYVVYYPNTFTMSLCYPRFIVLNDSGIKIKDTSEWQIQGLKKHMIGGGNVFKDKQGGYFHWGFIDSISPQSTSIQITDFPDYFAHLDSNFKMDWVKNYFFDTILGHRFIRNVKQLSDSSYMLIGRQEVYVPSLSRIKSYGWASHVDKNGKSIWDNTFTFDSLFFHEELNDGQELQGNGFAFCGLSCGQKKWPTDNEWEDIWLVTVDSNGCINPNCKPTKITNIKNGMNEFVSVYPNPANDVLVVSGLADETTIDIFDMTGRKVRSIVSSHRKENIPLDDLVPSLYMLRLIDMKGNRATFKVIKE